MRTVQNGQHIVDRPQPFFAIVDALAVVKVAKMGDAAAAEANHARAGRIQRWAAFPIKFNAIVVHCPGELNFAADYISRHVAPSAQGEVALSAVAPKHDETATVPEVNNNDADEGDEDDDFQLGDPEPSASQQDLYDYRKARVTPLDWPAYKWPSVTELAAAQRAALDGQGAVDANLTQVPDELHKWAKDDIMFETEQGSGALITLINGRKASLGDNDLWRVDNRIWIPAARLDLHARLCVAAHAGAACHRGREATYADLRAWFYCQHRWVGRFVARSSGSSRAASTAARRRLKVASRDRSRRH